MGLDEKYLQPTETMLFGFTSDSIDPLGTIELGLTMGDFPRQRTVMVEFLVMNCLSVFNAVIGRPSLKELREVMSVHHLAMKFPTQEGIGCAHREQQEARACYSHAL